MKQHKQRSWSIKTKLIVIITAFMAAALGLLVLTQVFFLDFFYQHIKMHSVETAAEEIADAIGTEALGEYMSYWHMKEQLEILIVDAEGRVLKREMSDAMEHSRFDQASLRAVFKEAEAGGGTYLFQDSVELSTPNRDEIMAERSNGMPPEKPPKMKPRKNTSETIVYARVRHSGLTGKKYMVLIYATLSPVSATVRTLAFQFVVAIFVLVLTSVVISYLVAKKIASPLIAINEAAKGLASGTYQAPSVRGYREAEELTITLDNAAEELRRSEELQRELFANVSHDLRTPLTMITGYSEAIRDLPGEDSADNIQVVIDESNRLTRLVDDVLDLTKLRAGVQAICKTTLDFSETVRAMTAHCRQLLEPDGFLLQYEGEDGLVIQADELRLSQAVYNLIGNALAHVGEDKTVFVSLEKRGEWARLSVADHGKGIPKDEQDNIWKRYYRSKASALMSGSGLGLSIVQAVVERHGGRCGVDSEVGKGSCFWFEILLS